MKICYLLEKAGPYHIFRLNALQAHPRSELSVIETQPCSTTYNWKEKPGIDFTIALMEEKTYGALANILALKKPDVIVLTGYGFKEMLWALAWAVKNSVPVVMQSDSTVEDQPRTWIKERIKQFLLSHVQAAFVAGTRSSAYIQSLGVRPSAIFSPYDIVDNAFFSNTDETERLIKQPYFICISRLIPEKNLAFLVETFARLVKSDLENFSDLHLIIVGGGIEEGILNSLINNLNMEQNIFIKGFVHRDEVKNYYKYGIAMLLTSTSETWGLCINEAFAAGIPVITSSHAGASDDLIEQGKSGWHFSPKDSDDLLAKIRIVLSLTQAERQMIITCASQKIGNYEGKDFVKGLNKSAIYSINRYPKLWLRQLRAKLILLIARKNFR